MEGNLKYKKKDISVTSDRSFPNLKLKLKWPNQTIQMKETFKKIKVNISATIDQIFHKCETYV